MKKIYLLLFCIIGTVAAQDGGLTGEADVKPTAAQGAAIQVRNLHADWGLMTARTLDSAIAAIQEVGPVSFWQRLGAKGKRTLKWLNDLSQAATTASPAGTEYVSAETKALLAKWTANPDNTVTVSP